MTDSTMIDNTTIATPTTPTTAVAKPTAKPKRSKRKKPKTFQEAYHTLKDNATALQQQDEPDIDNLMTTVEESINAYKICQERINAVQQALDASFADDDIEQKLKD